ncbi:hypothetical protein WJ977_29655 [Achromobacter xylosoxidans]
MRLRHLQRSHGRIPRRAQGVAGSAWRGGVGAARQPPFGRGFAVPRDSTIARR